MNQLRLFLALIVSVLGMVSSYGQSGCTIPTACNYDPFAVVNDGSCLWTIDCAGNCGGTFILDDCGNCYDPAAANGQIQFNYSGSIEYWTVPAGVTEITVDVYGAQGGFSCGNQGGLGAHIQSTVPVTPGDQLKILVGGKAADVNNAAGGGGGSYLATNANVPLVVAGGGSGATCGSQGQPGQITQSGAAGMGCGGNGGINGNGGGDAQFCGCGAGGGGGFFSNGSSNGCYGQGFGYGFVQGGAGGYSYTGNAYGGFGGGAGTHSNNTGGGAGGGYSGGGAPYHGSGYSGGGGGSYYIGNLLVEEAGVRAGNGLIVIAYTAIPECNPGCNDPAANNYDPNANFNDGSCIYDLGCTDPAACNYQPLAITDNGTCAYTLNNCGECITGYEPACDPGCMDPAACNYDPDADYDDGSCNVPDGNIYLDCPDDITVVANPGDNGAVINYNMPVLMGSCDELIFGSNLQEAVAGFNANYSAFLSGLGNTYNFSYDGGNNYISDGGGDMYDGGNYLNTNLGNNLLYTGGAVVNSAAFGPNGAYATVQATGMFFMAADCDNISSFYTSGDLGADGGGSEAGFEVAAGGFRGFYKRVCSAGDPSVNQLIIVPDGLGITQSLPGYTNNNSHIVTGTNAADRIYYLLWAGNSGYCYTQQDAQDLLDQFVQVMPNGNTELTAGLPSGDEFPGGTTTVTWVYTDEFGNTYPCSFEVTVNVEGCTNSDAYNYNPFANIDNGSCTVLECDEFGNCQEVPAVLGCIDPLSCNYDPAANLNDGSCILGGCQDPNACNYDPNAPCDNGTCSYFFDCAGQCGGNYVLDDCGNCFDPNAQGNITFNYTGSMQQWVVPAGATSATIEVFGAQGGSGSGNGGGIGGRGARMKGDFAVIPGETINILVGGQGQNDGFYRPGGGGGTFVVRASDNSPLIIAGGGGGANYSSNGNQDALTGTSGRNGHSPCCGANYNGVGGVNGNGAANGPNGPCAGNGAGFSTDGQEPNCAGNNTRGRAYVNGGAGGVGTCGGQVGGFGGGGGGGCDGAGGGGGYSGGGGSYADSGNGGGGGSYNAGINQDNSDAINYGNGFAIITYTLIPECIVGCLDPGACNYNPAAQAVGPCYYPDGCNDPNACNFDPAANCNNGTCVYPGCNDANACNYDPGAGCDDGSCAYVVDCAGICGGVYVVDLCGNCYDPFAEAQLQFNYTGGLQQFVVPAGVTEVTFEAFGAQGGGGYNNNLAGGRGARMKGTFAVTSGETFNILVGQMGGTGSLAYDPQGNENGGGGGSFIVNAAGNVPYLVAGGGGGGPSTWYGGACTRDEALAHGQITEAGATPPSCYGVGAGGVNGQGGSTWGSYQGGAGGGFFGNGANGTTHCCTAYGGNAYLNGGAGGQGNCCYSGNNYGGYGGGGGGQLGGPGAGGGYSGGGSAGEWSSYSTYGGGGGSYNAGTNQDNESGVQTGNGLVTVTYLLTPECLSGCMDPAACNYDPAAQVADICYYPDGCTDPNACNFDPAANCNNGTCVYPGCNDPAACNFDPNAACNDGTCAYVFDCAGQCGGNYVLDACGNCFDPNAIGQITFNYTGSEQIFTAPATGEYTFEVWGAQGGDVTDYQPVTGGLGGYATGSMNLNAGENLYIYVGGSGEDRLGNHPYPSCTYVAGGFNGGGATSTAGNGTPGGGASDIRIGGNSLNDRVIVAGGGGGCGWTYAQGGDGGGLTGENGTQFNYNGVGAQGGSQFAGGNAGSTGGMCFYSAGSFGQGGDATGSSAGGGGGGGGWYGGGGGGYGDGGGGGSSYVGALVNGSTQQGVQSGDGVVVIHYNLIPVCLSGCTDPSACNYDPAAQIEDGSCFYPDGCNDPNACNFDPAANCNNGTCVYPGCNDVAACNYDPNAGCNDGSCLYTFDCAGVCGGNYVLDLCGNCYDPNNQNASIQFNFTGGEQIWTVPPGITEVVVELYGGQGGESYSCIGGPNPQFDGGLGGFASGTLSVSPGQNLYINVGGKGGVGQDGPFEGGFNGGGAGGYWGGGGGGATDIRTVSGDLYSRAIVAGGGGGGNTGCSDHGAGGDAGGLNGNNGISYNGWTPGGGGGQFAGGNAGQNGAQAGSFGLGGSTEAYHMGGGGGGWYGGGSAYAAGGGGGSSYIGGVANGSTLGGVNQGDGYAIIYYSAAPPCLVGCLDPNACNYDPTAQLPGVCNYPDGCNDPNACNFDPAATCNDGSCTYPGCNDPAACNFDPNAGCNDGSCAYVFDCAGVCGGIYVLDDCGNCFDPFAQGYVEFNYTGSLQQFVVPAGVTEVTFEVFGAQGGGGFNNNLEGGRGARMKGTFGVTPGETFNVLVGQMGGTGSQVYDPQGNENGGGGGSFVVNAAGNVPYIVAGGGGGGPSTQYGNNCTRDINLAHGQITESGATPPACYGIGNGGANGQGGSTFGYLEGGAGGGFYGNGGNGDQHCCTSFGGAAYLNGGAGGQGNCCYSGNNYGGYGGGGGGQLGGPGGGGGYSGGGSAGEWSSYSTYGGGGGSYNTGTNQDNESGVKTGNGLVTVTYSLTPYCVLGCTDPAADNYNPLANFDDGSCAYDLGCLDTNACNFDPTANTDDGSCLYLDCAGVCGGSFVVDACGNCYDPNAQGYIEFQYTGSEQIFVAPSDGEYTFETYGASGGDVTSLFPIAGGLGGYATGTMNLTAGETLYIYVGGAGQDRLGDHPYGSCAYVPGGYNGGGATRTAGNGTPGGGASDIRVGGNGLNNRVIVAGGGGGCGWVYAQGGDGGGLTGENGTQSNGFNTGGQGGTQFGGGANGNTGGGCGISAGSFGQGGEASGNSAGGGGGGGGWYGGGGGGYADGGGGGSSYVGALLNASTQQGVREGNGLVVIYFDVTPDCFPGCTDPLADNYDPTATTDDGSCIYSGCTDPSACNYDAGASVDNGSCIYVVDCAGVCGGTSILDDCGNCYDPLQVGVQVGFAYTGFLQTFIVPANVTEVTIQANGASGGNTDGSVGGLGASITGTFNVTPGQQLKIMVGQQGENGDGQFSYAGGGGGSFVTDITNNPLVVAGGGGGVSGIPTNGNVHGSAGSSGMNGYSPNGPSNFGVGGAPGQGATNSLTGPACGGNGGGFLTNGEEPLCVNVGVATSGESFTNGGSGGTAACGSGVAGGYGGGGGGGCNGAGGGGGYAGGGGSYGIGGNGGGGGSFNGGANAVNIAGVHSGNGQVIISYIDAPLCNPGCTDPNADNYDPTATEDDGTCIISGCTDPTAANYNPLANTDDGSCLFPGCTYATADNYNPQANVDDGSCVFTACPEVQGCTDPDACNFDTNANMDNGTCDYSCIGCTYPTATNYDPNATQDDGSCIFNPCGPDTYWDVNTNQCLPLDPSCPADVTGDGFINSADLLALLALFGTTCQ